jgi:hypothetical protein
MKFYSILAYPLLLLSSTLSVAQSQNTISYQTLVRSKSGQIITFTKFDFTIEIFHKSKTLPPIYTEEHTIFTNYDGLASLEIGNGIRLTGNYNQIDWSDGPYYVGTKIIGYNGNSDIDLGVTQLLSVPFALYAQKSGYAKIADSVVKPATLIEEDPKFSSSVASTITTSDKFFWNSKQNTLTAGTGISIKNNTISLTSTPSIHHIGEYFDGGIVFSLWKDQSGVEHGLLVDINNLTDFISWSNVTSSLVGDSCKSTWNGKNNTQLITQQSGHSQSAALSCKNSSNNNKVDWYLPSIDELSLIWSNRFYINKSLSTIPNSTQITNEQLWSSSEVDANNAYIFNFSQGYANPSNKSTNTGIKVRAIRAF